MVKYEKIIVVNNEVEARLMESILKEEEIPYLLKSYHDSAYDGIWQAQKGWGHIEAPSDCKDRILAIYKDIIESQENE